VRGGFFGGTKEAISNINHLYYTTLRNTLRDGLMGTEESIFTLMSYIRPEMVNLSMINADGLLYKFFEDVRSEPHDAVISGDGSLAIYALTYNLPKRFKLWVDSFKAAYPKEFESSPKYVINNSTDPAVRNSYTKLFTENGFTEMWFNNIGINDGRYQAAKHFDASTHQYMVFFEDDMLLHPPSNAKSSSGLCTHYGDIFDIAIDIVNCEGLDYLKLSFDELYGDNSENWGWYNLPEDRRLVYFPDNSRRTIVSHLGAIRGVPFAVGEFHYCNWPILFTKHGNRKVFLEVEYAAKFEQTWMSMVCTMLRHGNIRAGTLLGSIINHNRRFHYPKQSRKENSHY
jgi:hypothetical protein